ncbi:MAG: exodeoxyribonuclease VII small subunit [Zoogloeaceae bacterium]|jgi:exodeoxyribonuclease VII small subunit|nr:exodeoxyribonuclease VII small subunit [Zoogloeaceae bacterium]
MSDPALPSDLKFETALAELEALVENMENGALELEASIAAYERGMSLLRHCQAQLVAAEQKIRIMEDGEWKDWQPESRP